MYVSGAMSAIFTFVFVNLILISHVTHGAPKCEYSSIVKFLAQYNKKADLLQNEDTLASWEYETNMNKENNEKTSELSAKTSKFSTKSRNQAKCLLGTQAAERATRSQKRQLMLITRTASSSDSDVNKKMSALVSKMTAIYSNTKVGKKSLLLFEKLKFESK